MQKHHVKSIISKLIPLVYPTQPGKVRSLEETLKLVEEQVQAACLGVAQTVKDMQTETGIKDAFTQHWIEDLIERSWKLHQAEPQRSAVDIQSELFDWVTSNEDMIYNPFLKLKGMVCVEISYLIAPINYYFQDLMLQRIPLLRSFTPYSSAL